MTTHRASEADFGIIATSVSLFLKFLSRCGIDGSFAWLFKTRLNFLVLAGKWQLVSWQGGCLLGLSGFRQADESLVLPFHKVSIQVWCVVNLLQTRISVIGRDICLAWGLYLPGEFAAQHFRAGARSSRRELVVPGELGLLRQHQDVRCDQYRVVDGKPGAAVHHHAGLRKVAPSVGFAFRREPVP